MSVMKTTRPKTVNSAATYLNTSVVTAVMVLTRLVDVPMHERNQPVRFGGWRCTEGSREQVVVPCKPIVQVPLSARRKPASCEVVLQSRCQVVRIADHVVEHGSACTLGRRCT